MYTVSQKSVPLYFMITSANVDQFSYFSLLNSERICGGRRNYYYHLPLNLLPHYLAKCKCSTIQLYCTVNSVLNDEKRFIMVNVNEGCYFFFSTRANLCKVFKMFAFGICLFWLVNATGQWMRQYLLFNACQTFVFITERNE